MEECGDRRAGRMERLGRDGRELKGELDVGMGGS